MQMDHKSFWQLGLVCVTAILTLLHCNSIISYCANIKSDLILIYRHAHCIKSSYINTCTANSQYRTKSIYIHDKTVIYVT